MSIGFSPLIETNVAIGSAVYGTPQRWSYSMFCALVKSNNRSDSKFLKIPKHEYHEKAFYAPCTCWNLCGTRGLPLHLDDWWLRVSRNKPAIVDRLSFQNHRISVHLFRAIWLQAPSIVPYLSRPFCVHSSKNNFWFNWKITASEIAHASAKRRTRTETFCLNTKMCQIVRLSALCHGVAAAAIAFIHVAHNLDGATCFSLLWNSSFILCTRAGTFRCKTPNNGNVVFVLSINSYCHSTLSPNYDWQNLFRQGIKTNIHRRLCGE